VVNSLPDSGTTIRVLFPALDEPALSPTEETARLPEAPIRTMVLLVDDEDAVLDAGTRVLTEAGYRVLTACDGHSAIHVLKERVDEIDCVLLDLTMPGMSGEEAFDELIRIREDLPVILASGYCMHLDGAHFEAKGFAAFAQKPYRRDELVRTIQEVLARHK
jgi:CheY-like chemotaxis protein